MVFHRNVPTSRVAEEEMLNSLRYLEPSLSLSIDVNVNVFTACVFLLLAAYRMVMHNCTLFILCAMCVPPAVLYPCRPVWFGCTGGNAKLLTFTFNSHFPFRL